MSKDTKQSMDPFMAELEKAGLKDIQESYYLEVRWYCEV